MRYSECNSDRSYLTDCVIASCGLLCAAVCFNFISEFQSSLRPSIIVVKSFSESFVCAYGRRQIYNKGSVTVSSS